MGAQLFDTGAVGMVWLYVDEGEPELTDDELDEHAAQYWFPVGNTEDRRLTVAEAIQIADYYNGDFSPDDDERNGMAEALMVLRDEFQVRGWVE